MQCRSWAGLQLQCAVPACEGALTHAEAAAVEVWAVVRVAVREVATEVGPDALGHLHL